MWHPFQAIPSEKRLGVFLPLLILTLVTQLALFSVGKKLESVEAPKGVISFEFAGDPIAAKRIADAWKAAEPSLIPWATFNLGLDFLFIVLYSTTVGFACVWASTQFKVRALAGAGIILAWGQWLAGALDITENVSLLHILFSGPDLPWPMIARWCAIPKFLLIFAGLLYSAFGPVMYGRSKARATLAALLLVPSLLQAQDASLPVLDIPRVERPPRLEEFLDMKTPPEMDGRLARVSDFVHCVGYDDSNLYMVLGATLSLKERNQSVW